MILADAAPRGPNFHTDDPNSWMLFNDSDKDATMGDLVRTCEACRDAALAYGIPFISGKDSLHNQFTDSETGQVLRR